MQGALTYAYISVPSRIAIPSDAGVAGFEYEIVGNIRRCAASARAPQSLDVGWFAYRQVPMGDACSGGSSEVKVGRCKKTGNYVAIKIIEKAPTQREDLGQVCIGGQWRRCEPLTVRSDCRIGGDLEASGPSEHNLPP